MTEMIRVDGAPARGVVAHQTEMVRIGEYEFVPGPVSWTAKVHRWITPGTYVLIETEHGSGEAVAVHAWHGSGGEKTELVGATPWERRKQ